LAKILETGMLIAEPVLPAQDISHAKIGEKEDK